MNKAKAASREDGKAFLQQALAAEQQVLAGQLELSSKSISHDGVMGDVNEQHFIDFLRRYLPRRYAVDSGIVIDSNGATSDQIDIVIYDKQYTPTLLDQQAHRYIPAEAVYGVFEVKPTINKQYIEYAAGKASSVKALERTSVPIIHAGGQYPAKQLFEIVTGLVATSVGWKDGLAGEPFKAALVTPDNTAVLDCGLALSDRAFDVVEGAVVLSGQQCSLASFLFRLLNRLQALGTVPAIDWNRYAQVLGDEE
tara:strand:+ start:576 stop:1334 length:759 start_codon:yes stop_codon:yes gene_type:complete